MHRLRPLGLLLALAAPASAQRVSLTVPLETLVADARRDSTDPLAFYNLGLGYWVKGHYEQADSALHRADAIDPRIAEVQLALAYLPYARRPKLWNEEAKGKVPPEWVSAVNESYRRFRRTFLLDPMVDMRVVGLVIPPRDALVIGKNADRFYAALVLGLEYFWGGNYQAAFASIEEAYSFNGAPAHDKLPNFVLWYHGLAAAHLPNYAVAIRDFEILLDRAVEREQSDSVTRFSVLPSNEIRYVLATLLRRAGRLVDARAQFQEVLTTDLSFEMAHAQLAEIAEKDRRWEEAVQERQRAVDISPDDAGLRYDLGVTLAKAGRYSEAMHELERAEAAMPLNARVPYQMGQVAAAAGWSDDALKAYRRFVAIAPSRFAPQVQQLERRYPGLRQP